MTAITSPSKLGLYPFPPQEVQKKIICITNTRLLACDIDEKNAMLGMKIAVMRFGFLTNPFTELTVHACNVFTHLKLITMAC